MFKALQQKPELSSKEITCSEQAFAEFPNLLIGKFDNGIAYFDATRYNPEFNLNDFVSKYQELIENVLSGHQIKYDKWVIRNQQNHILIRKEVMLIFLMYIEKYFLLYMIDQMEEMMEEGICVSDSYLLAKTIGKLDKTIVMKAYEEKFDKT